MNIIFPMSSEFSKGFWTNYTSKIKKWIFYGCLYFISESVNLKWFLIDINYNGLDMSVILWCLHSFPSMESMNGENKLNRYHKQRVSQIFIYYFSLFRTLHLLVICILFHALLVHNIINNYFLFVSSDVKWLQNVQDKIQHIERGS